MMDTYAKRRQWSDEHLKKVKEALGRKFITESNFKDDVRRGIDLFIPELNFAVRIRQLKYSSYKDFTLRTSGGGDRSEYAKLMDRKVSPEFLFYGYSLDKNTVAAGYLIDLLSWRKSVILGEVKPQFRRNKDGSHFVAFPLKDSYTEQIA